MSLTPLGGSLIFSEVKQSAGSAPSFSKIFSIDASDVVTLLGTRCYTTVEDISVGGGEIFLADSGWTSGTRKIWRGTSFATVLDLAQDDGPIAVAADSSWVYFIDRASDPCSGRFSRRGQSFHAVPSCTRMYQWR